MKAVFNAIKRSPRLVALVATVAGVVLVPAVLLAWGPSRPTFTIQNPSDHVTFNSITDNPNIGDERDFVGIREAGTTNTWTDNMTVQPGKTYTVRMYVHNNAASNLNLVAQNVTAKFNLPTTTGKSIRVDGFIDSSNATPTEVYDDATFSNSQNFNLAYVPNSLKYENNYFGANGTPISESVFTSAGALLGYDKLDGNIPGCMQYAGYLSFNVTPQFAANFNVTKQVRKDGTTGWHSSVNVKPGDTVDYLLGYQNTSGEEQDNVWFQDTLPKGITYVPGSTQLTNAANTSPLTLSNNLTNGTGVNVGNYADNANAYVKFKAKVDSGSLVCGTKTYTNKVRVTVNNDLYKEATADVVVTKPCQDVPTVLPQTGPSAGIMTFIGLGATTAGLAYAATSARVRNLLRR
ncbi:MAG: DUF11 domain-containing protein [Candidatus Nomurabacteria bacterium]|nr:MAG: DUF11 domain-containing protein [Candidatus Nomurabacteria bacterium]